MKQPTQRDALRARLLPHAASAAGGTLLAGALTADFRMRLAYVTWLGKQAPDPQVQAALAVFAADPVRCVSLNARMYLQHIYGVEGGNLYELTITGRIEGTDITQ